MIVTTAFDVPGRQVVKVLGIARGNTVRSRNLGRDIAAGFKNLIGGEVKTYTEMTAQSRDEAFNRMINDAIKMGADAIIGFRFTSSTVMQMSAEILAYGTAVKLK
ncbi:MAG: YbjQ family protein [Nanobdellota archaeon]